MTSTIKPTFAQQAWNIPIVVQLIFASIPVTTGHLFLNRQCFNVGATVIYRRPQDLRGWEDVDMGQTDGGGAVRTRMLSRGASQEQISFYLRQIQSVTLNLPLCTPQTYITRLPENLRSAIDLYPNLLDVSFVAPKAPNVRIHLNRTVDRSLTVKSVDVFIGWQNDELDDEDEEDWWDMDRDQQREGMIEALTACFQSEDPSIPSIDFEKPLRRLEIKTLPSFDWRHLFDSVSSFENLTELSLSGNLDPNAVKDLVEELPALDVLKLERRYESGRGSHDDDEERDEEHIEEQTEWEEEEEMRDELNRVRDKEERVRDKEERVRDKKERAWKEEVEKEKEEEEAEEEEEEEEEVEDGEETQSSGESDSNSDSDFSWVAVNRLGGFRGPKRGLLAHIAVSCPRLRELDFIVPFAGPLFSIFAIEDLVSLAPIWNRSGHPFVSTRNKEVPSGPKIYRLPLLTHLDLVFNPKLSYPGCGSAAEYLAEYLAPSLVSFRLTCRSHRSKRNLEEAILAENKEQYSLEGIRMGMLRGEQWAVDVADCIEEFHLKRKRAREAEEQEWIRRARDEGPKGWSQLAIV